MDGMEDGTQNGALILSGWPPEILSSPSNEPLPAITVKSFPKRYGSTLGALSIYQDLYTYKPYLMDTSLFSACSGAFSFLNEFQNCPCLDANLLIQLKTMYAIAYLLALSATQASPTASLKISKIGPKARLNPHLPVHRVYSHQQHWSGFVAFLGL